MTETEIQELETKTGCQLPAVYRELLLNYPQRLTDLATTLGIEELELLYHSRDSLARVNGEDPEYLRSIFPPHCFVIGENGNGDYYAIDTQSADGVVYMSGPHWGEYPEDAEGKPLPYDDSLQEYIEFVVHVYEEAIQFESELDDTTVYRPPGMLTEYFSIALSLLLMPILLLLMLCSLLLTGPFVLLMRLWDRIRPLKG
ncbi:SMI1 / KNR4 family protein [Gimesia panareensis]|uniref:SMI1 / KNR4 family protein n=1 Tax=Gimesia panareensis TaxID=2527978 RepID=A0A517QGC4_9PLAN|nr:SMI1/KNR4 family protein [Gimesia panareensis]QDT30689.1 SMI1 / KNR4 family protein [Gimesia panareensis]